MFPRILLTLVSLYLLGRGGYELHRSGVFGAPVRLECPGPRDEPLEPRVHRVVLRGCALAFDEMMYLHRADEVVGVLLPLRRKGESFPIGVLLQITDPELVATIVDDETPLAAEYLPALAGDVFEGYLLPRDTVSAGRAEGLIERYEDIDPAFRILELGSSPDGTDGVVMFLFGMLGLFGIRRLGIVESAPEA